ncbi:MAG TPA: HepT-like ribonuclease domain-containing protein [Myxococcaceae bacterium]
MVEAATEVAHFISGRKRSDLDADSMLLFAVVRAIEIVGEAASKVSEETRAHAPAIPWKAIVGTRNRIVHAYFDIDKDILWKAAAEEIPALAAMLRTLAGEDEDQGR